MIVKINAMKQIIAALVGVILASGVLAWGQAPELQRIPFSAIQSVSVGNAQDDAAGTGVTVFRLTVPGRAAVAVFGGGPASRETEAIAPERNHPLNALVFSGGSAYGLAASGGVARCLEEHGVGFDTGIARVPIVCQSCIYDLGYSRCRIFCQKRLLINDDATVGPKGDKFFNRVLNGMIRIFLRSKASAGSQALGLTRYPPPSWGQDLGTP